MSTCHDCGSELIPSDFPGIPAGTISSDGELWVECPQHHRGHWESASLGTGPLAKESLKPVSPAAAKLQSLIDEQRAKQTHSHTFNSNNDCACGEHDCMALGFSWWDRAREQGRIV